MAKAGGSQDYSLSAMKLLQLHGIGVEKADAFGGFSPWPSRPH